MNPKLLDSAAMKLRLGGAAAAILVIGYALAPSAVDATPQPGAEARPAPLLEEQVQQREAARPERGEEAGFSRPGFVTLEGGGRAVFVSPTQLLTHADALDGRVEVAVSSSDGRTSLARALAYDAATGIVLLETQGTAQTPARFAAAPVAPGTPVYMLDGSLLAVAAQELGGLRGYEAQEVYERLRAQVATPEPVPTTAVETP